jgi:hypothetical protein
LLLDLEALAFPGLIEMAAIEGNRTIREIGKTAVHEA